MVRDKIITDILLGQDTLSPALNRLSQFGNVLNKNFANAQSRIRGFGDVLKQTGVDRLDFMKPKKRITAQDLIDDSNIDSQLPNLSQLMGGVSGEIGDMNKIKSLGSQLGQLKAEGVDVTSQVNHMKQAIGGNTEQLGLFNNAMDQSIERSKEMKNRFDMNTLSWMFGGMALQRVGLMMMRFFIPATKRLNEMNTEGAKKVMGLQASFEFLKISMFETLSNTDLFKNIIEFLIRASEWISEFVQKHPKLVAMMGTIAAVATILGTIAIGVGIFKQLAHLGTLIGISTDKGIWAGVKGLGKSLGSWVIANPFLAALAAVVALLTIAVAKTPEAREEISKLTASNITGPLKGLGDQFMSIFDSTIKVKNGWQLLAAVFGWAFTIPAAAINVVITAIDTTIESFKQAYYWIRIAGLSLKKFFTLDSEKRDSLTEKIDSFKELSSGSWENYITRLNDHIDGFNEAAQTFVGGPDDLIRKWNAQSDAVQENSHQIENGIGVGIMMGEVTKDTSEKVSVFNQEVLDSVGSHNQLTKSSKQATASLSEEAKEVQDLMQYYNNVDADTYYSELNKGSEEYVQKINQIAEDEKINNQQLLNDKESVKVKTQELQIASEEFGASTTAILGDNTNPESVIGKFNLLGLEITLDHDYFKSLRDDIEKWASTVTTKTIKIRYKYENKREDSGTFERIGRGIDEITSSITG